MVTRRSTRCTSSRLCVCCAPVGSWPWTTCSGTTRSPIPPLGTRPRPFCETSARRCATTIRCFPPSCRWGPGPGQHALARHGRRSRHSGRDHDHSARPRQGAARQRFAAFRPLACGVLALDNMLWHDTVADPATRDETTTILRDLGKALRDNDSLLSALLPVGDGLLAAVKR